MFDNHYPRCVNHRYGWPGTSRPAPVSRMISQCVSHFPDHPGMCRYPYIVYPREGRAGRAGRPRPCLRSDGGATGGVGGASRRDGLGQGAALTPDTRAEKIESYERIISMRATSENFDSCNSCKLLKTSCLHELHESNFSFVSRIEFIHSKLSFSSAHVSGVTNHSLHPANGAGWRRRAGLTSACSSGPGSTRHVQLVREIARNICNRDGS